MTEPRKRKPRKTRVTDISLLGLEVGKLYEFKGRSRLLYKERSPNAECGVSLPKIRHKDHLIFFKADLWECDASKTKTVYQRYADRHITKLKNADSEILRVEVPHWSSRMRIIYYKSNHPIYSGMMYVGFGDRFGWINIVQMTKKDILEQFKQVA